MMTDDEMIAELVNLAQCDIDAIEAYQQAIDSIKEIEIADTLRKFKNDHQRHVEKLNAALKKLGATPLEHKADFKGFIIKGFTAIRSLTGTAGALKAMISNEEFINKRYLTATIADFSDDYKTLVTENYSDEKHHLETLKVLLTELNP